MCSFFVKKWFKRHLIFETNFETFTSKTLRLEYLVLVDDRDFVEVHFQEKVAAVVLL